MKLILTAEIAHLGAAGDTVEVKTLDARSHPPRTLDAADAHSPPDFASAPAVR